MRHPGIMGFPLFYGFYVASQSSCFFFSFLTSYDVRDSVRGEVSDLDVRKSDNGGSIRIAEISIG